MPIIKQPMPAFTGTIIQPNPIWQTPAGIVSAVDADTEISVQLNATDPFAGQIIYTLTDGILPGSQENFGDMVFLLHADEPEASIITVNSVTQLGVPLSGSMNITNTESKFGLGSIDNQNKEGFINFGPPSTLGLSSSDFSIHGWFNRKANPVGIFELVSNQERPSNRVAIKISLDGTSTPVFQLVTIFKNNFFITALQPVPLNTWVHIALVKQNSTMFAFVGGILQGAVTLNSSTLRDDANGDLFLCASGEVGQPVGSLNFNRFNGRVDEFVIERIARWVSNFTPPTSPFTPTGSGPVDPLFGDVTFLTNMEGTVGTSSLVNSITSTSLTASGLPVYTSIDPKFGATSMNYLSVGSHHTSTEPFFNFGTGDWTVEVWFKPIAADTVTRSMMLVFNIVSAGSFWSFEMASGKATCFLNGFFVTSTTSVTADVWNHLALSRESGTNRLFLNGNLEATAISSTPVIATGNNKIGAFRQLGFTHDFDGFIDDIRITGAARYTTNFTPTGPFAETVASIPGVKLSISGLLSGNVGPFVGPIGSDLHNFTVKATSNLTTLSTDRDFNITVLDPALNTDWETLWAGSSAQHVISSPTTAQFEAATPNNIWITWPSP